nr:immunoglobulin heavy chain junction region [Macaca mulatta]
CVRAQPLRLFDDW